MNLIGRNILAVAAILAVGTSIRGAVSAPSAALVPDPAEPGSVTAGIQEAVDRLPEGGGVIAIPVGVHVVQATVRMKPNTTFMGAGKGSIIRKDPAWIAYLAEDVSRTSKQAYVVVKDAAALKPKMSVCVSDLGGSAGEGIIERIEENKVFIRAGYRGGVYDRPWAPACDLLVSRKAALFNGFPILRMASACRLADLALDGNKAAQAVGGERLYEVYAPWWERLRCAPYVSARIERCWIYDAAGVAISLSGAAVIEGCEIYGNWQGVHAEGGAYSKVINNTIHDNDCGVAFCLGCTGLMIQGNHIHHNETGIGGLGTFPDERLGRIGDFFSIISGNVIYHNAGSGIASGQGKYGPRDFVISDNVVYNNNQRDQGKVAKHGVPAGISLFNAQRCVITGNRCFDDQDEFPGIMAQAVSAGARELPDLGDLMPLWMEHRTNIAVIIQGLQDSEVQTASTWRYIEKWQEKKRLPYALQLAAPLAHDYPAGTEVIPRKTQIWGLFVGGADSSNNIVANNLCLGNQVGGILWGGRDIVLSGNLGGIVEMDSAKTLLENVHPFLDVPVANAGFEEDGGWQLVKGASSGAPGHTGKRALRLAPESAAAAVSLVVESGKNALAAQPNTRYRVSAWIKSEARRGTALVLPRLLLVETDADGKTFEQAVSQPALNSDGLSDSVTTGQWLRVMAEGCTGPRAHELKLRIQMAPAEGTAWVDDVCVQQSPFPLPVPAPATNRPASIDISVPRVAAAPQLNGGLEETGWKQAARIAGLVDKAGKAPAASTSVYVCHDGQSLFVAFECADARPDLILRKAARESEVLSDDCVAVLLAPDVNATGHYQFALSAGGVKYDQYYDNGRGNAAEFNPDWQAAAQVTPAGWTARLAIPLDILLGAPPAGAITLGANFGRRTREREWSSWIKTDNWHNTENYGRLQLSLK